MSLSQRAAWVVFYGTLAICVLVLVVLTMWGLQ